MLPSGPRPRGMGRVPRVASPLVRLEEVTRHFGKGGDLVRAVDGVSLDIPAGVFFAVVGRSGSGKTTLLNLVGGLDRPTGGRIDFAGAEISSLPESGLTDFRRRSVSFVFQSFGLLPLLSAYENVELPLRIAGVFSKERGERVRRALDLVRLTPRAAHRRGEAAGARDTRASAALCGRPRRPVDALPSHGARVRARHPRRHIARAQLLRRLPRPAGTGRCARVVSHRKTRGDPAGRELGGNEGSGAARPRVSAERRR